MTRLHVLAVGDFGAAVADALPGLLDPSGRDGAAPDVVVTPATGGPAHPSFSATWPRADVRVLASWREVPALAELLDDRSARWGTPWLPVVLEHPLLRVGPFVVPGASACHRCFRSRVRQHEPAAAHRAVAALHELYDRDPVAGPRGHLPHHVVLAAALAAQALADPPAAAGEVRSYHLLDNQATAARVVGVHGCDRCRPAPAAGATWARLADGLAGTAYGRPVLAAAQGR